MCFTLGIFLIVIAVFVLFLGFEYLVTMANSAPLSQVIESFRKFDGTSPVETWLKKFNAERADNSFDELWAIRNLDRVVTNSVKSWWLSVESIYSNATATDAKAKWKLVEEELKKNFGGESLKKQAKLKMNALRFKLGENPQAYVLAKAELFVCIDPAMSNGRKIDYLIDGIPEEIALQMICSIDKDNTDPMKFLERLSSCANYLLRKGYSNESICRIQPSRAGAQLMAAVQNSSSSSERRFTRSDPNGRKQCFHCGSFGHLIRECFRKADEEGRERPKPKQGRNFDRKGKQGDNRRSFHPRSNGQEKFSNQGN